MTVLAPTHLAFAAGLASAAAILATLVVTLLVPDVRLWPPGERSWPYYLHWSLVGVFDLALVAVAALEWNSWLLPRPTSLVVGTALSVVGAAVFLHSGRVMETAETAGLAGDLYTDGPYARSRNPQYVGMLVGLVGFALLANAALVTVLVAAHVAWLLLLPFAEEPWLRERFGDEYDQYCETVPRFVGRRSFG